MNEQLWDKYSNDLQNELRKLSSVRDRVEYLRIHLEEYVDRFLGFSALPHFSNESLLQGGLFIIVRVAVELISNEIRSCEFVPAATGSWHEFVNFTESLRAGDSRSKEALASLLHDKCESACRELSVLFNDSASEETRMV